MLKLLIHLDDRDDGQRALDYVLPIAADGEVSVTVLTSVNEVERAAALFSAVAPRIVATEVRHVNRAESADLALCSEASAGDYDLVVFGELRERWSRWIRLTPRNSLSAELPISSLLVRGTADRISRILLCAGGDETVIADARLTARLARRAGASATILHVLSQMPMLFGAKTPEDRAMDALAAMGAPEVANMRAAVDVLESVGVKTDIKVRIGLVLEQVVDELQAGGYDLLVIGAHRSQGVVERLLLEDVTRNILGQSPVPVLVVKTVNV